MDRERQLHGDRGHCSEQQLRDGLIEAAPGDVLTDWPAVLDSGALTDICGPEPAACEIVAHRHPVPADATHDEALQSAPGLRAADCAGDPARSPVRSLAADSA